MSKLGKFAAACAAVLCAFGTNVARADALVPSGGDDTAAILDAITNATEGATVELGQGTFLLSSTLKFNRNVRLVGAGAGQTILDSQNNCRGVSMTAGGAVLEGVTISNCSVSVQNGHGGGVNMTSGTLRNCRVTSCSVSQLASSGGGIYMTGGTVTNCDIHANNGGYNHSTVSYGAGIVYLQSGTLTCSRIHDNSKNSVPGIYQKNGTVVNCLIYNNTGTYGAAGIYKEDGYTYNCTIYNCVRSGDTAGQSGISQSNGTFRNNIVWGNTGVCELVKKGGSVDHCCYPEAKEGVNSNTAKDPLLKKGCVIKSCSPCRDAGVDQPWMTGATDLCGNPRICDDRVDIGCFEVRPSGLMLIVR